MRATCIFVCLNARSALTAEVEVVLLGAEKKGRALSSFSPCPRRLLSDRPVRSVALRTGLKHAKLLLIPPFVRFLLFKKDFA